MGHCSHLRPVIRLATCPGVSDLVAVGDAVMGSVGRCCRRDGEDAIDRHLWGFWPRSRATLVSC
jgi:hypothetical protein